MMNEERAPRIPRGFARKHRVQSWALLRSTHRMLPVCTKERNEVCQRQPVPKSVQRQPSVTSWEANYYSKDHVFTLAMNSVWLLESSRIPLKRLNQLTNNPSIVFVDSSTSKCSVLISTLVHQQWLTRVTLAGHPRAKSPRWTQWTR